MIIPINNKSIPPRITKSSYISLSLINLMATAVVLSMINTLGNTNGNDKMDIIVELELLDPDTDDTNVNTEEIPSAPNNNAFINNETSLIGLPRRTVNTPITVNERKSVKR